MKKMISTKLSYLGWIVATIMMLYGILGLISSLPLLILIGIPYGLDNMQSSESVIQNLLSGIVLVIPGSILFFKSKLFRELIGK